MSDETDAVAMDELEDGFLIFDILNINHENYRDIGSFVEDAVSEYEPDRIGFNLTGIKHIPTVGHSVFIRTMNKFEFLDNIYFIGTESQVQEALEWVLKDRTEADKFHFKDTLGGYGNG